jgi:HD superfamily phosphohydrolase
VASTQEIDLPEILDKLEAKYRAKGLASDFDNDRAAYAEFLLKIFGDWDSRFGLKLNGLVAVGTAGSVWHVHDRTLERDHALKLSHPRLSKLPLKGVRAEIAEPRTLATLNHQNVVRVYLASELKLESESLGNYNFSFFTMDYLDKIGDFDDYIIEHRDELSASQIIQFFRDALSGIAYLHDHGIIHCDIKPANMFIAPSTPALVGDLGYSKKLLTTGETTVTTAFFTEKYAHPTLREYITARQREGAAAAPIPRSMLKPSFDLFAFGRSMQQVLSRLWNETGEALRPGDGTPGQERGFTRRQWLYLSFIAQRLLDGQCENAESDVIPGLTKTVMGEIRYKSAEEALEDFEKLLGLYDLEGDIPELRPDIAEYIQIPHTKVPCSRRVSEIINHPAFSRLATVTQLGFVSAVYPGATHTRFEHALGTFTHCCIYLRSLWYDEVNPLFQSVMTADDLEAGILAALLHDIGQYPMAHDLHESADPFSPDFFTSQMLCVRLEDAELALDDMIRKSWGGRGESDIVERMLGIIKPARDAGFRERALNSMISGPYDCDKIDYLQRDSTHLGVTFGHAIDCERLVRNLTLVYKAGEAVPEVMGFARPAAQVMQVVGVGIREKGLAAALVVCRAREDMFRQVYWQHSVRAQKAMLSYVVRTTWLRLDSSGKAELRARLYEILSAPNPASPKSAKKAIEEIHGEILTGPAFLSGEISTQEETAVRRSVLSPSDDAILEPFFEYSDGPGQRMIRDIRQRRFFRRLCILSYPARGLRSGNYDQEEAWYQQIYSEFKRKRRNNLRALEDDRIRWEREFIEKIRTTLQGSPDLLPTQKDPDQIASEMSASAPVLLVDVPVKSLDERSAPEVIWYLPEELTGIHARQLGPLPSIESVTVDLSDREFDLRVGKIRVLIAPEWLNIAARCINTGKLRERDIWEIIARSVPAGEV